MRSFHGYTLLRVCVAVRFSPTPLIGRYLPTYAVLFFSTSSSARYFFLAEAKKSIRFSILLEIY